MIVKQAVERLMQQMQGACGLIVMGEGQEMREYVLVRRSDLEMLMATWEEKKNQ